MPAGQVTYRNMAEGVADGSAGDPKKSSGKTRNQRSVASCCRLEASFMVDYREGSRYTPLGY